MTTIFCKVYSCTSCTTRAHAAYDFIEQLRHVQSFSYFVQIYYDVK